MTASPSVARAQSWTSKTRTPFDPFDPNFQLQKELTCPQCNKELAAREPCVRI